MKKLSYLLILLLGLFLTGCDSDDDDEILAFSILKSEVCFSAKGGEGTIEVAAPEAFKASSTAGWCSATINGNRVKVNVAPNPEYLSRTALVQVSCLGRTLSVPVTQEGSILILENNNLSFKPMAGRYAYLIGNNVSEWEARVPQGITWCAPSVLDDTLILQLDFNPKASERTATVTILSGNISKEIALIQEGIVIRPSQEEVEFTAAGGTEIVTFTDLPKGWMAEAADSWCTLTSSGDTLFITAPLYTEATDRSTAVTISIGEVTATIPVIQTAVKPLNELFCTSKTKWYFNPQQTTGDYTLIFQMISQELSQQLGEMLVSAWLYAFPSDKGSHVLTFITFDGNDFFENSLTYNFVPVDGTENQVAFTLTLGTIGDYTAWYYNNIQGIQYLANYLNASFIMTADDPIAPTQITFTDTTDPDLSFTLSLSNK